MRLSAVHACFEVEMRAQSWNDDGALAQGEAVLDKREHKQDLQDYKSLDLNLANAPKPYRIL